MLVEGQVERSDRFKSRAEEIEDLEEFASIIGQRVVYLGKALNMRGKSVDVAGIDGITADGRFVQVKNLGKTTGEKSVPENIVEAYKDAVKAPGKIEGQLGARVTINHLEIFIIARQFSKQQVIEAWEKYLRGETKTKLDRAMIENPLLVWRATVLTSEGPIQLRPN